MSVTVEQLTTERRRCRECGAKVWSGNKSGLCVSCNGRETIKFAYTKRRKNQQK